MTATVTMMVTTTATSVRDTTTTVTNATAATETCTTMRRRTTAIAAMATTCAQSTSLIGTTITMTLSGMVATMPKPGIRSMADPLGMIWATRSTTSSAHTDR